MSESKEEDYKPENTGFGDLLKTVNKVYKEAYNKGIEDLKEALKKEIEVYFREENSISFPALVNIIDTVQPTEK